MVNNVLEWLLKLGRTDAKYVTGLGHMVVAGWVHQRY